MRGHPADNFSVIRYRQDCVEVYIIPANLAIGGPAFRLRPIPDPEYQPFT